MGLPQRDTDYHTYGEYLTWADDVRYELIDGVAYLMAPAPTLDHQDVVGEVFRQLANALLDKPCRAYVSPVDVRLPKGDEADDAIDTVVQPDVLVVCDASKTDRRGIRGAPDLAIEVLSPGTASHDQVRKLRLYERAGVREYWLVHPVDRVLTIYRLEQGRYGKPDVLELGGETRVGVLEDVVIRWDQLLGRLPVIEP